MHWQVFMTAFSELLLISNLNFIALWEWAWHHNLSPHGPPEFQKCLFYSRAYVKMTVKQQVHFYPTYHVYSHSEMKLMYSVRYIMPATCLCTYLPTFVMEIPAAITCMVSSLQWNASDRQLSCSVCPSKSQDECQVKGTIPVYM